MPLSNWVARWSCVYAVTSLCSTPKSLAADEARAGKVHALVGMHPPRYRDGEDEDFHCRPILHRIVGSSVVYLSVRSRSRVLFVACPAFFRAGGPFRSHVLGLGGGE